MTTPQADITPEVAREVMRLNELYVDGTLRLSLAADSRALSISGMLAAASTLLVGYGASTLLAMTTIDNQKVALGVAALWCGGMFATALIFSVRSVRPRNFNITGNFKSSWSESELRGSLAEALLSQASVYENQARKNVQTLSLNAISLKKTLFLTAIAVPTATIVGLLILFLPTLAKFVM
ncbi:hypothetical protein JQ633_25730 [Bradyrhizobium tropiciagri]|uniref:hypothetical protein n=1 Tax=Bradyrhizobium tropiciagri TaxID=312253 RepID=UPI001BAA8891|nr:hypothetical protein [Bradyrhizobium tropiciagri]MBR0873784.1 hypothetical protein [Bradyrhizobium tropiciagri]